MAARQLAFFSLNLHIVINHFKHHHIWHTRHCSVLNALTHLMTDTALYVIDAIKNISPQTA